MISIIIATYNRSRLLDECLAHLARQPFGSADEVIVVDNGSTDRTEEVVLRRALDSPVTFQYLVERRPGKSHALARALHVARGDLLAFTDDDVNVGEGWLDAIRRTMADGTVALTGGPVLPRWERQPPPWLPAGWRTRDLGRGGFGRLAAPLALLDYGPHSGNLGPRTLLGANLAARRDVMDRLGGFAPHLGKLRGTLLSGEDHDLCSRAQAAGFKATYSPSAPVYHLVPAERMRVRYFVEWFFWSGITNAALDREMHPARELAGVPLFIFRRLAEGLAQAAAAAVAGRATAAVEGLTHAAFAAGYAAGRWGYASAGTSSAAAGLGAAA